MTHGWHRPNPWDPFGEFQREVGRLFGALGSHPQGRSLRGVPPINLREVDHRYILTTPLPGMGPDEVELSISGDTLTIRGERRRPEGVAEENYRRQERALGRWTRTITLPDRVASAAVEASFAHGVLTVTIPRAEDVRPRQINIATEASPSPSEP